MKYALNRLVPVTAACLIFGSICVIRSAGVREVRQSSSVKSAPVEIVPAKDNWPWWRGISSANVSPDTKPPLTWSASQNVKWRIAVPGRGHASPCLSGKQLFLSTADDEQKTMSLMSIDAETGQKRWQTELHRGGFMPIHAKNTHASSTPACDGKSVYIASTFDNAVWVTAVDTNGQIEWQEQAGPYCSEWGYGSSVAIHQSVVIVAGDNRGSGLDRLVGNSWLAALDRSTGKIVWRVKRPEGDSFGSPIVANIAGRNQLLLAGKSEVNSYDPLSGRILWTCRWDSKRTANTVAVDDRHVYASTRQPKDELICIKADGDGDVTETHVVWRSSRVACDVPSPCVSNGFLYVLRDDGVLSCLTAADGRERWKKRLGGTVSSSPLVAGRHLFCANEEGTTFVFSADGSREVIAENTLDDGILASPIVSRDRIYIRTLTSLYCLSAENENSLADSRQQSEPAQ